jgi:glycosyltransferase involved in cell wall biosynthesis
MWNSHKVSVVVPAFNEARLIGAALKRIPAYVDRIFVIDDGSRDRTWDALRESCDALRENGDVRVVRVRHAHNRGVGAAIVSGYYRAIAAGMDYIAVMAGDAQMAPEDLEALLVAAQAQGADYVKGNRFVHADWRRMPTLRRLGSRGLSWLTRRTTGLEVDDCQCGYTVIDAAAASEIPLSEVWPRYGYPNDLLALLASHGKSVVEVPVKPVYAAETSGLHAGHVLMIGARIVRRWLTQTQGARQTQGAGQTA